VSCNTIYFCDLKLKREDISAFSKALESQKSEAQLAESPVINSSPSGQLLETEILFRRA
jgi:hypothetical protein